MSTLWCIEPFGRGGIARYTVDVAALCAGRFDRTVVGTTPDGPAPGWSGDRRTWFPVRSGPLGKGWGALGGIVSALRLPQPGDVVWAPLGVRPAYELALCVALRARRGRALIVTVHNRRPHDGRGWSVPVARSAALASRVVVHSGPMLRWCEGLRLPAALLPFPAPRVDVAAVPVPGGNRDRLDVPPGHLVVVMIGNLLPYKGVSTLLTALAEAMRAQPDLPLTLVLAGQAPANAEPLVTADRLGVASRIRRIPGYLDDDEFVAVLRAADAVALPYLDVDHSGVAALAIASGVPAVASDLPTLREQFAGGALFTPPGDVASLARSLTALPAALPALRAALPPGTATTLAPDYRRFAEEIAALPRFA